MFCSFREVAVATLHAMLEFNLFCPPGIADKPFETRKKVFEAFWASEEERIGDEREGSWSHWVVQRAAHLGTATTAKRQRSRWGDATQPVAVAPKPQDASKAVLESRSGTQAMEAAYETATKMADAVVGPQDADAAGGAAEVWGFLADPAADVGGQATMGLGDGQAGATPGVGNGSGSGADAGGISAAPAGPVHGPELPPGPAVPDLPHGRVRIIDGRPMVCTVSCTAITCHSTRRMKTRPPSTARFSGMRQQNKPASGSQRSGALVVATLLTCLPMTRTSHVRGCAALTASNLAVLTRRVRGALLSRGCTRTVIGGGSVAPASGNAER